ncbi:hypothetical protein GCM10029963_67500 [Micromonospora andamanensis]
MRAIYDYFSEDNGFSYRLSTEQGTSGQAILDFLENKVGYCQQYAAALAWMVRDAGSRPGSPSGSPTAAGAATTPSP